MTRRRQVIALWAVAALTVLAYVPVFWAGQVYDDRVTLATVPYRTWVTLLGAEWQPDRALTMWTYAIQGAHASDLAYHLGNLSIHLLNGLALYAVLRRGAVAAGVAILGVGIFWLHPLQSEAVAYLTSRPDLVGTFGLLCGAFAVVGTSVGWPLLVLATWVVWHAKDSLIVGTLGWTAMWACRPRVHRSRAWGVTLALFGLMMAHAQVATVNWRDLHTIAAGQAWTSYAVHQLAGVGRLVVLTAVPMPWWQSADPDMQEWDWAVWIVGALAVVAWTAAVLQIWWRSDVPARLLGWRLGWWVWSLVTLRFVVPTEWMREHQWYPILTGMIVIGAVATGERGIARCGPSAPSPRDQATTVSLRAHGASETPRDVCRAESDGQGVAAERTAEEVTLACGEVHPA